MHDTPPSGGGASAGAEVLPMGEARLVEVDMAVDDPGQDEGASQIDDLFVRGRRWCARHRLDRYDLLALNQDFGLSGFFVGRLGAVCRDTGRWDPQIPEPPPHGGPP